MGCLGIGLAAVLALAAPASIARSSLIGAYVVIGALLALAVGGVMWRARQGTAVAAGARRGSRRTALSRIGLLALAYGIVVTLIHTLG